MDDDAAEDVPPALGIPSGETSTESDALTRIRRKRYRILVVDDEDRFRASLRFMLQDLYGATVEEADTGLGALDTVTEESGFDLILMDIAMPGMSGIEACRAMRARGIDARIVLLSAYYDSENRAKAHALGITLLNKPMDEGALERVLLECGRDEVS